MWGVLISVHSNSNKVRLGRSWTYAGQTLYVDFGGHLGPRGVDEDGCGLGCVGGLRGG